MKDLRIITALLAVSACTAAEATSPAVGDALRAEKLLAAEIRSLKQIGYPEFEKQDTGEQPVAVSNLRCDGGKCSYDLLVQSKLGRRTIHRPGVTFCQNPQDAWVHCVN